MQNLSGDWYFATPTGQVHVGDDPPPPDGSTVLVAPGGELPGDMMKRYAITEEMLAPAGKGKGKAAASVPRDAAGEPIVVKDGRSYAAGVLPDDDEDKQAVMKAAEQEEDDEEEEEEEAGAKDRPAAQGKAVRLDKEDGVEDKAVSGPGAQAARKAPTKPAAKGK